MPNPEQTTSPNQVGPIQSYPYYAAIPLCHDVVTDLVWIYNEVDLRLSRSGILGAEESFESSYCGGIRIVIQNGWRYMALAMDLYRESPVAAYNRAMSIIKQ